MNGRSRKIHTHQQNTARGDTEPDTVAKTATVTEGYSEISPYEYIKKANLYQR